VTPFRRLLRLAVPVRGWIVLATLSSFAALAANVALMTAAPYLISRAALVSGFAALALSVTAVRAFAIARAALRYVERYTIHLAALRILTHLRVSFYRAVEPLAPAGLGSRRSGDLLARAVADVDTLDGFFVRGVVPPVAAVVTGLFAGATVALFASPALGVVLGCGLALVGIAVPLATRRGSRRAAADVVRWRASLHAELADDVTGLADLMAFGAGSRLEGRLGERSRRIGEGLRRLAFVRGAGTAASGVLSGLVGVTLLVLAVPLVRGAELEGAFLAAVPLVAFAAFEAVQPLSDAFGTIELSRAAAVRTFELVDAPPAVVDPPAPGSLPTAASLELRHVSFRYDEESPWVLEDVTFEVQAGERLGLTGPSGAGKSSIVSLLLRFWEPNDGTVLLGGQDVRSMRAADVRSMIGVVLQRIHLFNGSLRDNLLLADGDADDERITEALRRARLGEFVVSLPAGLDTHVGDDGLKLSGGERQRVALARVFLKDAPILILDEATSHLDAATEADVLEAVDAFALNRTVLVVAHRAEPLRLAGLVTSLPAR
jgi:ATP-binding cassette subfamily C protein CydC